MALAEQPAITWQSSRTFLTTNYSTGVLVHTLQGLVNRRAFDEGAVAPPLLLDTFELFNQFYSADRHWALYLAAEKGFRFDNLTASGHCGLGGLLQATCGAVNGSVLYDGEGAEPDATRYVALTLCGLESLLPVTPALRAAHPLLKALPVVHDLRGRFKTNGAAYDFAFEHLMPRVNRSVGWSAGRSHVDDAGFNVWQGSPPEMPLLGLDIAIARSGFMFNLSPNSTGCSDKAVQCHGSPQEAALFDKVMAGLNGTAFLGAGGDTAAEHPLPSIYGWTEAESAYTIRVSQGGGVVLCSGAPNLSFWAYLPVAASAMRHAFGRKARAAAAAAGPPPPLQKKTYITFQTNEGDTPKIVAGFFGGSWLNPKRGSVPIAWGVNLVLAREFPGLMEYFAATATANDTFFGGTSGAGYDYPSEMPRAAFARYAATAQDVAAEYFMAPPKGAQPDWAVDIWNWGVPEGLHHPPPTNGEIPWPEMIRTYAKLAPSIGSWSQQSINSSAVTQCIPVSRSEASASAQRTTISVSFAPTKLWYPGQGKAAWSHSKPSYANAMDDLEARLHATEKEGQTVFSLVYGLVDGNSGPGGLDAVDAAAEMARRLPASRFEIIGAQEMARLSAHYCEQ